MNIDESELVFSFIRSSGPGGQNVNKVSTAVQLRFDVRNSRFLSDYVRSRLQQLAKNRMTSDGVLVITAQKFRGQLLNRQDAVHRLNALVEKAAQKPKARKKTAPSWAGQKRRLESKSRTSSSKRSRSAKHDLLD
jgi:ribosome-associated protein